MVYDIQIKCVKIMKGDKSNLCQQLSIIEAHCGSTSAGISNRWFMKPTAPITCKYPKEILVKTPTMHHEIREIIQNQCLHKCKKGKLYLH